MILTKHLSLREMQPGDAKWSHSLRNHDPRQLLPPLEGSVADQRAYILNAKNDPTQLFWVISDRSGGKPLGQVRWTRLDDPDRMGWESLLLHHEAPPSIGIDIMCLTYNYCFRVLGRHKLGPWSVLKGNPQMMDMHVRMGFAFIESVTDDGYRYTVTRDTFDSAWPKWHDRGFGIIT